MFKIGDLIKTNYPMFFITRTFEEWERCKFASFLITNQETINLEKGEICMILQTHKDRLLLYHLESKKIITGLRSHFEII